MKTCWIFFFFFSLPCLCSLVAEPIQPEVVTTIDVEATKDLLLTRHYRYLDVRIVEEFQEGHLEKSLNIPYMFDTPEGRVKNPKFMEQVVSVCDKEDQIVVGCRSGVRSVYASIDMLKAEFKHVYNMGGGYIDWVKKGFAVKKPEESKPKSEL